MLKIKVAGVCLRAWCRWAIILLSVLSGGSVLGANRLTSRSAFEALSGTYTVVSLRKSGIVSPAVHVGAGRGGAVGKAVRISPSGIALDGISCEAWRAVEIEPPPKFGDDPALSDLRLPPLPSGKSSGDRRIGRAFEISCEGERFAVIWQADSRVLAMAPQNSHIYLVLERPLGKAAQRQLAKQLIDRKFLKDGHARLMGEAMISALRAYYRYCAGKVGVEIPRRPAITMNLLDGLGVF